MSDTLHLVDSGDEEVDFARFVALLGVTPGRVATFSFDPRGDLAGAWRQWCQQWFPDLSSAFITAYGHGIASRIRELQAVDQSLDATLSGSLRERSTSAASGFLDGKEEMRGNREWTKFADGVDTGVSPGHLPVVFALQSALYHLPLSSALAAYAWFEFQSRHGSITPPAPSEEERKIFEEVLPEIANSVQTSRNESTGGFEPLEAL